MHRLLNSPGTPSPPQPPYVITWTVKIRPFPCPTQICDLHRTGYIVGSPGEWVLVSHLLANLLNMQQRSRTIRHRQPSCSLRAWAKTSHLLVTKNARTCGQQNSTPMCNEMQVASIDWMLWNNQLLVGQILLHAICSLHKPIPRIGFADFQRWFAAICIKILARFFIGFLSPTPA